MCNPLPETRSDPPRHRAEPRGQGDEDRAVRKAIALAKAPELHRKRMEALLARIKQRLPELKALLTEIEDHWGEEDGVYRLYHQSYKVFHLQGFVKRGLKWIAEIGGAEDPPCR